MRLISIGFASVVPIILVVCHGPLYSLSQYWSTPYQPLFILSNAITAYFFFSTPNWRIPSFFLILLTAFSLEWYSNIHDILALCFFITCAHSLYNANRLNHYYVLFILALCIMPFSLLYGEILAILLLCGYHAQILIYKHRLDNRHEI